MKKGMIRSTVAVMFLTLFTSCGVEAPAAETRSASGSASAGYAVSGSAVAVKNKKGGQDREKNCYQNDTCRYEIDGNILYQYCLNEKSRLNGKRIELDGILEADAELSWVTSQWLYYESDDEREKQPHLFRIPIKKTKEGECLQMEEKDELFPFTDSHLMYATDSYLIVSQGKYRDDVERGHFLSRYDLKDKKWTRIIGWKKNPEVLWGYYYPVMIHDRLIINAKGELYSLDPDSGEMDVLCTYSGPDMLCVGSWEQYKGALYFLMDRTLSRYDGASRQAECVISEADFLERLDSADQDRKDIMIEDMVLADDKLYIDVLFRKKEPGYKIIYNLITGEIEQKVSKD